MTPEEVAKLSQELKEKVRRMTNLELWNRMRSGVSPDENNTELYLIEIELEWRLRKIAFLPALPPEEDA